MGMWGSGLFDDDLAMDIKGGFDQQVEAGAAPADVAKQLMQSDLAQEILEEFAEDERDDMFWEESGGLFFAVATLQLEHGALDADVKRQTLQAIEAWNRLAEGDTARITALAELRSKLEA